jgi:hypothetical protein
MAAHIEAIGSPNRMRHQHAHFAICTQGGVEKLNFFTRMLFVCCRSATTESACLRYAIVASRHSLKSIQFAAMNAGPSRALEAEERLAEIGGDPARRRQPAKDRPIAGTQLIREYQGVEHCVTVRDEDFDYQGRPYKSLSAIARAITGTRWNGWLFFGLKNRRRS